MKTHVLTFSRNFPAGHPRAGSLTMFVSNILRGEGKLHTIRGNFPYWLPKIQQVQNGEAVLSLRYWTGKPYNSPQNEFAQLMATDGVGIERLVDHPAHGQVSAPDDPNYRALIPIDTLAENDGLSLPDFRGWFREWGMGHERAIIHFTPLRYAPNAERLSVRSILSEGPVGPLNQIEHGIIV